MKLFGFGGGGAGQHPLSGRLQELDGLQKVVNQELEALLGEVRALDQERGLLIQAALTLCPALGAERLAENLFNLCREPFNLDTFYVGLADYEADLMSFPFYLEGGKPRKPRDQVLSAFKGLTTKTMEARVSRYYPTLEALTAAGASFTEAERVTRLIPETWYGIPLGIGKGWPPRPFGLVSFQSFSQDAFSLERRAVLDALATLLALALKAG